MIIKTEGIVLQGIKYGDTSLVVRIFTRSHGVQSYLVQGVRKARARMHHNLFQPTTLVELVAYHKEQPGLQRIREITGAHPYHTLPLDILKTTIALFLAEVLTNTLRESDASPPMYDFVREALITLDDTTAPVANFHLVFLLQLSRYLGFAPRDNHDPRHPFFNLQEGLFQPTLTDPHFCLDEALSRQLLTLMHTSLPDSGHLPLTATDRRLLLNHLVDYYRYHLEGLRPLLSHQILENVLH